MEIPRRSVKIPDNLWKQIPTKNKSDYIRNAIQEYLKPPHANHTQQQELINHLKNRIEDLKKEVEYHKTQYIISLPFWKRWLVKRLLPPRQEE